MRRLFIDQKLWSLRERFTVNDEHGRAVYTVEGSLFKTPKQFSISDSAGRERARVWKKPVSWLPRFFVEIDGKQVATIAKQFTLLRSRYTIDGPGLNRPGSFGPIVAGPGVSLGYVDRAGVRPPAGQTPCGRSHSATHARAVHRLTPVPGRTGEGPGDATMTPHEHRRVELLGRGPGGR